MELMEDSQIGSGSEDRRLPDRQTSMRDEAARTASAQISRNAQSADAATRASRQPTCVASR
jgi:hypothetical protein